MTHQRMTKEEREEKRIDESARKVAEELRRSFVSGLPAEPNWYSTAGVEAFACAVPHPYMIWRAVKVIKEAADAEIASLKEKVERYEKAHRTARKWKAVSLPFDLYDSPHAYVRGFFDGVKAVLEEAQS